MKKRYIVLIAIGCILFVLFNVSIFIVPIAIDIFQSGKCEVEISDYRLAKDSLDNDIIIVSFDFENNADYITCLSNECEITLYQDGVGLVESYDVSEEYGYNSNDMYRNLKEGASYKVEIAYELIDNKTDVEVNVDDYSNFSGIEETKIFKLAK